MWQACAGVHPLIPQADLPARFLMPSIEKSPSPSGTTNFNLSLSEMLRMQSMEEMVTIMASVDSVWNSPGLTEVGVGGPVARGTGLLQDGQISEFWFQVCSSQPR